MEKQTPTTLWQFRDRMLAQQDEADAKKHIYETAKREGRIARYAGDFCICPYAPGTTKADGWLDGFNAND